MCADAVRYCDDGPCMAGDTFGKSKVLRDRKEFKIRLTTEGEKIDDFGGELENSEAQSLLCRRRGRRG